MTDNLMAALLSPTTASCATPAGRRPAAPPQLSAKPAFPSAVLHDRSWSCTPSSFTSQHTRANVPRQKRTYKMKSVHSVDSSVFALLAPHAYERTPQSAQMLLSGQ